MKTKGIGPQGLGGSPLKQAMGADIDDDPSMMVEYPGYSDKLVPFEVPIHRRYDAGNDHKYMGPDNTIKPSHWSDGTVHKINYPDWEEKGLKDIEPDWAYRRRFFNRKEAHDKAIKAAKIRAANKGSKGA